MPKQRPLDLSTAARRQRDGNRETERESTFDCTLKGLSYSERRSEKPITRYILSQSSQQNLDGYHHLRKLTRIDIKRSDCRHLPCLIVPHTCLLHVCQVSLSSLLSLPLLPPHPTRASPRLFHHHNPNFSPAVKFYCKSPRPPPRRRPKLKPRTSNHDYVRPPALQPPA